MPYVSRSYFHPVAKQFFDKIEQASGNVSDKNSVNNFVDGLSRIIHPSLWVCWPLRSTQNIGTGTTAYNFGGLSITSNNFSLTNGPTWTTNGISFDGIDDYLQATTADCRYGSWMTLFYLPAYITFSQHWIAYNNAGRSSGATRQFDNGTSTLAAAGTIPVSSSITTGSPTAGPSWVASFVIREATIFSAAFQNANLSSNNPTAILNPVDRLRVGLRDDGGTPAQAGTICSLMFYTSAIITNSQKILLYSLLKSTLGQGLALP